MVTIRNYGEQDRQWAQAMLTEHWGSPKVVARGRLHQADKLDGFVAEIDGERQGLVTYRISDNGCEVVTLDSLLERHGVAQEQGCLRVWLITTNDNVAAQAFYRKRGFAVAAVHKGAVREARKLKPEIPERGIGGIVIEDEIEFEFRPGRRGETL